MFVSRGLGAHWCPLYMAKATLPITTSSTNPPRAKDLHAFMWHPTASIVDWVTNNQGGNLLQDGDMLEHSRPSKLFHVVSKLLDPEVPTSRTLWAAWRIFVALSLGWTDHKAKGCSEGFTIEVNYYLQHFVFVDGAMQEGSNRCSSFDLAIPVATPLHPDINLDSLLPPHSPAMTTTSVNMSKHGCRRRTCPTPTRSRFAFASPPRPPTFTYTPPDYSRSLKCTQMAFAINMLKNVLLLHTKM